MIGMDILEYQSGGRVVISSPYTSNDMLYRSWVENYYHQDVNVCIRAFKKSDTHIKGRYKFYNKLQCIYTLIDD